jgi:sugar O-acyltransferase (sialic acid O-acetyltransferase NeuD family)
VVGAGGHGKVVADILLYGGLEVLGFLDDDEESWGQHRLGLPVLGPTTAYVDFMPVRLAMGIGHNTARQQVVERLGSGAHSLWCNAIHPTAYVAGSVRLGTGVMVAAGAVVNPDAALGDYCIVNTGATVDHDCLIGAYAHVAPGVHLSGGVRVGAGALIGVGACVAPLCTVGDRATIGAGAAVVRDIPPGVIAKGVPARW